jgi:hypothetical protein
MPVPAVVFRVISNPVGEPVVEFVMKYSLDTAGQTTFLLAVKVPVILRNIFRASSAAPFEEVRV